MTKKYVLRQSLAPSQIVSLAFMVALSGLVFYIPKMLSDKFDIVMGNVVYYLLEAGAVLLLIAYCAGLLKVLLNGNAVFEIRDGEFRGFETYYDMAFRSNGRILFNTRKPIRVAIGASVLELGKSGGKHIREGKNSARIPEEGFDVIILKFREGSYEDLIRDIRSVGPIEILEK